MFTPASRASRSVRCPKALSSFTPRQRAKFAVALGRLGPFETRAQQWQNARLAGPDRTMCRVFWSEEDLNAYFDGTPAHVDTW
ncbi:MAG TPA: hypothetical protein VK993_00775 [Chthoniobacterales bacterium]|nr:hypothetical protein [Chthoniobacterales bacterium]